MNEQRYYEACARLLRSIGAFDGAVQFEEYARGGRMMHGRQLEGRAAAIDLVDALSAISYAAGVTQ